MTGREACALFLAVGALGAVSGGTDMYPCPGWRLGNHRESTGMGTCPCHPDVPVQLSGPASGSTPAHAADAPADRLNRDIDAFAAGAGKLPPQVAARRWLALFDRTSAAWSAAASRPAADRGPVEHAARRLMASLPPPAAWPELRRQIDARPAPGGNTGRTRHHALVLMGRLLAGRDAGAAAALQTLRDTVLTGNDPQAVAADRPLSELEQLVGESADPKGIVRRFATELEQYVDDPGETLALPDLYRLGDPGTAERMAKVVVGGRARIELSGSAYTDNRVLALARQHVGSMRMPHFELVTGAADAGLDAAELYEAMDRRFPADGNPGLVGRLFGGADWNDPARQADRRAARVHYLAHLIDAGKTGAAAKVVAAVVKDLQTAGSDAQQHQHQQQQQQEQGGGALPDLDTLLQDVRWTPAKFDAVAEILRHEPRAPLWTPLARGALHLKRVDRVLELAAAAAARPDLDEETRIELRRQRWDLLLGADRPDEAVALVLGQLKASPQPPAQPGAWDGAAAWSDTDRADFAAWLSELAALQKRPDWSTEAIAVLRQSLDGARRADDADGAVEVAKQLAAALGRAGRAPDAVRVLVEQAETADEAGEQALLIEAAGVYHAAGRHRQVRELLDGAEGWGAADAADLLDRSLADGRLFGEVAGSALVLAGDRPAGLTAFGRTLASRPDDRSTYAALLAAAGADATDVLDLLDRVARGAPGSAAPLAWKAEALRRAGLANEAEGAARAALAAWPGDALDGRAEHLLQPHRTLAAVLLGQGRDRQATEHGWAIAAAILVEQAAAAEAVGLTGRAITLYEQAIEVHGDWAEVRARLADLYAAHGDVDRAGRHAAAAAAQLLDCPLETADLGDSLRLMFASRWWRDEVTRAAEARLQEEPADSRAHFLLGLAQLDANRQADAAVSLTAATVHNPKFLTAWAHLQQVAPTVAARSQAALKVLELDRSARADRIDVSDVLDLKKLWELADRSPGLNAAAGGPVYRLAASAAALGQAGAEPTEAGEPSPGSVPGAAVGDTGLMSAIRALMFGKPPSEL